MLNIFVDAGADLNVDEDFAPPIIFSVDAGNAAHVEKMLRLGANPNFEHADTHLSHRKISPFFFPPSTEAAGTNRMTPKNVC